MLGSATAIVQGGVFGIAGVFPPKYTGAVMVGQGIAGLTVNFLRAVCLLILPPDEDLGREDMNSFYGTIIYFALSGVVLLFGCLAMLYLRNMPFALYYINRAKQAQEGGGQRRPAWNPSLTRVVYVYRASSRKASKAGSTLRFAMVALSR